VKGKSEDENRFGSFLSDKDAGAADTISCGEKSVIEVNSTDCSARCKQEVKAEAQRTKFIEICQVMQAY
jgi:hypothetical protein